MPAWVRSEQLWNKAKDIARKAKPQNFWAYANAVYHKMEGLSEDNVPEITNQDIDLFNEIDTPIKSSEDEFSWYGLKHFVFNHPLFNKNLSDDEKYEVLEEIHAAYKKYGNHTNLKKLEEYASMWMLPGARIERPRGPIVYGFTPNMPFDSSFGNSTNSIHPQQTQDDNIEVPINLDKKSDYQPWETDLTPDGENIDKLKRNPAIKYDEVGNEIDDVLTEFIYALEDNGYIDVDDFKDMTPEEIEDSLISAVKKFNKESDNELITESISNYKNIKNKLYQTFEYTMMTEEQKKSSRIQDAREMLSSRHQQKDALKKDKDNSYIIDQYGIEKLMKKFGYIYDFDYKKWIKDKQKIKDVESGVSTDTTKTNTQDDISDIQKSADVTMQKSADNDKSSDKNKSSTNTFTKSTTSQYTDTQKIPNYKIQLARILLFLVHKDKVALESNEEGYIIPNDQILAKMELLKYVWVSDKHKWVDSQENIPQIVFDKAETNQSLLARAILSTLNPMDSSIQQDPEEEFLFQEGPDSVNARLIELGYEYNFDIGKWYIKTDSLEESILYEAEDKQKSNHDKNRLDKINNIELQSRFLYAAEISDLLQTKDAELIREVKKNISNPTSSQSEVKNSICLQFLKGRVAQSGMLSYTFISPIDDKIIATEFVSANQLDTLLSSPIQDLLNEEDLRIQKHEADPQKKAKEKEKIELKRDKIDNIDDLKYIPKSKQKTITLENIPDTHKILMGYPKGSSESEYSVVIDKTYDVKNGYVLVREDNKYPFDETIQSLTARSELKKLENDMSSIQIDIKGSGQPLLDKDDILQKMEDYNYKWSEKTQRWVEADKLKADAEQLSYDAQQRLEYENELLKRYNYGESLHDSIEKNETFKSFKKILTDYHIRKNIFKLSDQEWYQMDEDKKNEYRRKFRKRYKLSKEVTKKDKEKETFSLIVKKRSALSDFMKGPVSVLGTLKNIAISGAIDIGRLANAINLPKSEFDKVDQNLKQMELLAKDIHGVVGRKITAAGDNPAARQSEINKGMNDRTQAGVYRGPQYGMGDLPKRI